MTSGLMTIRSIKLTVLVVVFLQLWSPVIEAQLDTVHYLPPLHNRRFNDRNNGMRYQAVYLSTPSVASINVEVRDGGGNLLRTIPIDNNTPGVFDLNDFYGNNNGTYTNADDTDLSNNETFLNVSQNLLNTPLTNYGLILTSSGGEFYANYRAKMGFQAGSLTAKGNTALGTEFHIGGTPNNNGSSTYTNLVAGFMAVEDSTVITISGYANNTVFHDATANFSALPLSFTLDAGETYVISTYTNENIAGNTVNELLGAHVISNNPIVVSNGNLLLGAIGVNGQNRDIGMDQSVPIDQLGTEYVFFRGNHNTDALETPVIIATVNNTEVFVNGVLNTTLANAGDFVQINGSNYTADDVMYIRTSRSAYAYQQLFGANSTATPGLNFIPPLSCYLPQETNYLALIEELHPVDPTDLNGEITIVTFAGSDIMAFPAGSNVASISLTAAADGITIPGTTQWIGFRIPFGSVTANTRIESTGPLATGIFGTRGSYGVAGYFSGFGGNPNLERIQLTEDVNDACHVRFKVINIPDEADGVEWIRLSDNRIVSRDSIYEITNPGSYMARIPNGTCSNEIIFDTGCTPAYCDDLDGDGVNNIDDVDMDNDGIADTVECSLVMPLNNSSFDNSSAWTTGPGWNISGGEARITANNVSNVILSQAVMDLNTACDSFVVLSFDIQSVGNGGDVMSLDTASLDISLGGQSIAQILNPSGGTEGTIMTYPGVYSDAFIFPLDSMASASFFSFKLLINYNGSNAGNLEFNFNAQDDDFAIDNVALTFSDCSAANDLDGDGLPNCKDLDSDNDGIPDEIENCGMLLSDTLSVFFADSIGCGTGLLVGKHCPLNDTDGDGILNYLDLDSDNDGIWDAIEAGHDLALDTTIGRIAGADVSSGSNGLYDLLEITIDSGRINYTVANSEAPSVGAFDAYTLDSDGDGCYDVFEADLSDSDEDGVVLSGTPTVSNTGLVIGHNYANIINYNWRDASFCLYGKKAFLNPHIRYNSSRY